MTSTNDLSNERVEFAKDSEQLIASAVWSVFKNCGFDSEVDDVISRAHFKIVSLPENRFDGEIPVWTIVRNFAIDELRRLIKSRKRFDEYCEEIGVLGDNQDVATIDATESQKCVEEILSGLTDPERRLIVMRYLQKQDWKTIADDLGIEVGAAKMQLKRLLGFLRETWSDRYASIFDSSQREV